MKRVQGAMVLLGVFVIFLGFIGTVSAANLTVNPGDSIQSAVDNASDGDMIVVKGVNNGSYVYNENVVVNKRLTIKSYDGHNVTVQALNYSNPVFTINSGGNGSSISGFTITDSNEGVHLNSVSDCVISGNYLTSLGYSGISLTNSNDNELSNNYLRVETDEGGCENGIYLNNSINNFISKNEIYMRDDEGFGNGICLDNCSQNNTISLNNVECAGDDNGIFLSDSPNIKLISNSITRGYISIYAFNSNNLEVYGNNIEKGYKGIYLYDSLANVHFNRINVYGFFGYGLINQGNGTVDATNNWWGTNNPTVSSNGTANIEIMGGTVIYDPWLVLNVNTNPVNVVNNSTVTADLTHNSNGDDTFPGGHVPEGIPVNFTTNLGTITGTVYTRNGKANSTLNRGGFTSGTSNITVTVDSQSLFSQVTLLGYSFNTRTGKWFTSIQATIDDPSTVDGDVIYINQGSYRENVVVSKRLTIQPNVVPDDQVSIEALDTSLPVFSIIHGGSGSYIGFLELKGATNSSGICFNSADDCKVNICHITGNKVGVYLLNSARNVIDENELIGNHDGIDFYNSCNNNVTCNYVAGNNRGIFVPAECSEGIQSISLNNTIYGNIIGTNIYGIYLKGDMSTIGMHADDPRISNDTTITANTITGNTYGIYSDFSGFNMHFNRISNNHYGLWLEIVDEGIEFNAGNNWWGTTNPVSCYSSFSGLDPDSEYDLVCNGGIDPFYSNEVSFECYKSPILVLTINTTQNMDNTTAVTADLTHNNHGADTSSQGHVPDNIPVNFTTNLGTITGTVYTRNGKASAIFNRGTVSSGIATITAMLDNQRVQTDITIANVDSTAPTVTANLENGTYNTYQNVTLTATDNFDPNPVIYYTLDGTTPTVSSTRYATPISIIKNDTVLKFMAVDAAGNQASVQTRNYMVNLPIINLNTNVVYSSIQAAIDDPLTVNGHIIEVGSGIYTENVIVNKSVTLKPVLGFNVLVRAQNYYNPTFLINSGVSGSISGFIISDGIYGVYLDSVSDCVVSGNIIRENGAAGIWLLNSNKNNILQNTVIDNGMGIILQNSMNNTIYGNNNSLNIEGGGINLYNSTNNIC